MKRLALVGGLMLLLAIVLTGCVKKPATTVKPTKPGSTEASRPADLPSMMVNKNKLYLTPTEAYDPAKYPKTAMTGAPSDIPFFAAKDEGIKNRVYPAYDAKTFKVLVNMAECLVPEWYYMFKKDGGTLNKALAPTGFKTADIFDSGHLKMQTNLMLGYYDFAYIPTNVLTEYWSGRETQAQELWRGGSDYVVIGAAYDGGVDLQAPSSVKSLRDLAGKRVGIMNVGYHSEMMLHKALQKVGLDTASAGGNVWIEMAPPGTIMNGMLSKKYAAAFVWKKYVPEAQQKSGYRTLLKWTDMGYGTQQANVWLVARRDIVEKYPEVVQAVVQANYDGAKQAIAVGDYKATCDSVYTDYWMTHYGEMRKIVNPPRELIDARANPAFLHDLIDYMRLSGAFTEPYTYDQLVNDSFYNNVKK